MVAKLVAEEGNLKGLVLPLDDGEEWVIGRDPDACQLLIEDPSTSRKHLMCRSTPEGIVLENLSSTNPVHVNEEEVNEPRLLQNGDLVKIGAGLFRFYAAANLTQEEVDASKNNQPTNGNKYLIDRSHPPEKSENGQQEEKADNIMTPEKEENFIYKEPSDGSSVVSDSIFKEESDLDGKDLLAHIDFGMLDSGRWLLKVVGGPNSGAEFSMQAGSNYIMGTDPNSCDLVFHDTSVSRQHARISITDDQTVQIEDLHSRNGTFIEGKKLEGKQDLSSNTLVSIGTTSFVVFDREGEMHTIISPLMPSIVKVLQKEEPTESPEGQDSTEAPSLTTATPTSSETAPSRSPSLGAFILIGMMTGVFVITSIGITTLFKSEPVVHEEPLDHNQILNEALAAFPNVNHSFNKSTGRLLLVGHVMSPNDKNQIMYNLQGLKFIKNIDDSGVVIDEYAWREINQVLSKNPAWRGISVISLTPGHFVLSGYLQTRAQADRLSEYIGRDFLYPDLLENHVFVDEEIQHTLSSRFEQKGYKNVQVKVTDGDVVLSGAVPPASIPEYQASIADIKNIPGIRGIKNLVVSQEAEKAITNISKKYEVTGISKFEGNISAVINGRILTKGDVLDGMTITEIKPNMILLEKDNSKFQIDYSR